MVPVAFCTSVQVISAYNSIIKEVDDDAVRVTQDAASPPKLTRIESRQDSDQAWKNIRRKGQLYRLSTEEEASFNEIRSQLKEYSDTEL